MSITVTAPASTPFSAEPPRLWTWSSYEPEDVACQLLTGEQADQIADAALRGLLTDTGRAVPGPPGNPDQEERQAPWST